MNIQIHVQSEPAFQLWRSCVHRACSAVLEQQEIREGALTVVLANEETIQQLNLEFAGEDHATDVLSFPSGELDPESGICYLGDIIIAVPVAQRQAETMDHSLEDEMCLLAVHGTLHLLGFDHADSETRSQMWDLQDQILGKLGIEGISWEG
jgi:probable rRNA maturation factor